MGGRSKVWEQILPLHYQKSRSRSCRYVTCREFTYFTIKFRSYYNNTRNENRLFALDLSGRASLGCVCAFQSALQARNTSIDVQFTYEEPEDVQDFPSIFLPIATEIEPGRPIARWQPCHDRWHRCHGEREFATEWL